MEAVEDVESLGAFLTDELEIGLPHVRADEEDIGNDLLAHGSEESLEEFEGSFFADPEQAGDTDVDLIDEGEILVAFGVLDLIDADGIDLAEGAVLQAPGDNMLDRVEDLFPGSAKCLRGFLPRQAASPAGQKEHVDGSQSVLAVAPGDLFDDDGVAAAAIDAPHGVQQEDEESPKRNELKAVLVDSAVTRQRKGPKTSLMPQDGRDPCALLTEIGRKLGVDLKAQ